jgi:hypothetical protein
MTTNANVLHSFHPTINQPQPRPPTPTTPPTLLRVDLLPPLLRLPLVQRKRRDVVVLLVLAPRDIAVQLRARHQPVRPQLEAPVAFVVVVVVVVVVDDDVWCWWVRVIDV